MSPRHKIAITVGIVAGVFSLWSYLTAESVIAVVIGSVVGAWLGAELGTALFGDDDEE